MISGIGIDIVRIDRFAHWRHKSRTQLRRVLSDQEIDYCLENPAFSAHRFAARFAAKEAFLKALRTKIPLLTICKAIQVMVTPTGPELAVNWGLLKHPPQTCHISISHEKDIAVTYVIIERD
jgi:holo-[acyl-carrier protein] synthase